MAGLNACTNGCMSVLDRSCFSYQVAAGSTTSENSVVDVIRKSNDSSMSSLPTGASGSGWSPRSRWGLTVGSSVTVVIKSTGVMLAVE
jgi:hypothetical protein